MQIAMHTARYAITLRFMMLLCACEESASSGAIRVTAPSAQPARLTGHPDEQLPAPETHDASPLVDLSQGTPFLNSQPIQIGELCAQLMRLQASRVSVRTSPQTTPELTLAVVQALAGCGTKFSLYTEP